MKTLLVQLVSGECLHEEFDATRVSFEPDGWFRVYGTIDELKDPWSLWAVGSAEIVAVRSLDDNTIEVEVAG